MLHTATAPNDANSLLKLLKAHLEAHRFTDHTARWHQDETAIPDSDLILRLHRANYDLWHLEDRARDPNATDSAIAEIKRSIDRTNQRRNDLVEQIDNALMQALQPCHLPAPESPLHSETPGMILDRLSIIALKIFHTAEESTRPDATEDHRQRNGDRLSILRRQSDALTGCLSELWQQIVRGERRFELYRQMKMYNDPALNPVLYTAKKRSSSGAS